MPRSAPLKVRISPKAVRIVGCISPNGGQQNPAMSNTHPKVQSATEIASWIFLILFEKVMSASPRWCALWAGGVGEAEVTAA